jgi:UPF0755 protein
MGYSASISTNSAKLAGLAVITYILLATFLSKTASAQDLSPLQKPMGQYQLYDPSDLVLHLALPADGIRAVRAPQGCRSELVVDLPGPLVALTDIRIVNISFGSSVRQIANLLVREGVIEDQKEFMEMAPSQLKSGEYQFTKRQALHDVVKNLTDGKVSQYQITIAEGLSSELVVQCLMATTFLSGNINEIPKEGSMLPESYHFPRDFKRDQVIKTMQEAQHKFVEHIWEHRAPDLPLDNPDELVTLASIVEKETGRVDERTRVAGVFVNRLKQHMRLQSDPTIIYGLVEGKGTLGRSIMRNEIQRPTPYNTYAIERLPPGPICNPGRQAMDAVAHPDRTKELYFVANGAGGHAFSETNEQHQEKVRQFRALTVTPKQ